MTEEPDGLRIEARISKTQAGDEVLELVRDGALGGLSIGFSPIAQQWSTDRQQRTHREVALHEISGQRLLDGARAEDRDLTDADGAVGARRQQRALPDRVRKALEKS